MSTNEVPNESPNNSVTNPEVAIQRMYIRDLSLEAPNSPFIFKEQWQPELKLELNNSSLQLEPNTYEVLLTLTCTVSSNEKVAFLIEVKKAGIFTLKNFSEQQLHFVLNCVCPSIIFPYAREVISDTSTRAGFPPLILAPINFEAIYAQKQKASQQQNTQDESPANA